MITAPWTSDQVDVLNRFQREGRMHPFTCGYEHGTHQVLVATEDGWRCPSPGCTYTQDWAHPFMFTPERWPKPLRPPGEWTPPPPDRTHIRIARALKLPEDTNPLELLIAVVQLYNEHTLAVRNLQDAADWLVRAGYPVDFSYQEPPPAALREAVLDAVTADPTGILHGRELDRVQVAAWIREEARHFFPEDR